MRNRAQIVAREIARTVTSAVLLYRELALSALTLVLPRRRAR